MGVLDVRNGNVSISRLRKVVNRSGCRIVLCLEMRRGPFRSADPLLYIHCVSQLVNQSIRALFQFQFISPGHFFS
jgi:hypothetical protein